MMLFKKRKIKKIFLTLTLLIIYNSCSLYSNYSLKEGKRLYKIGEYENALKIFEKVYLKDPDQKELAWQYIINTHKALQQKTPQEKKELNLELDRSVGFICEGGKRKPQKKPIRNSITFIESSLREALLELSTLYGTSIIADETVESIFSANINDLTLEESLDMILSVGNYSYKKIKNFYLVGKGKIANDSFSLLSYTCLYKPVYLKPKNIQSLVSAIYQPYLKINDGGLISITAPASVHKKVQKDIIAFDRKPSQVLMELTIIEVSNRGKELLGINWDQKSTPNSEAVTDETKSSHSMYDGTGINFQHIITGENILELKGALKWLNKSEDGVIKASPSIVTLDGQLAKFSSLHTSTDNIQQKIYKVDKMANTDGDSGYYSAYTTDQDNITRKEGLTYGVTLELIPQIAHNREIILEIKKAEVSDLTTNVNNESEIVSHTISNTIRIHDGETLVLGGLLQRKKKVKKNEVPYLSAIPIIGWFFKDTEEIMVETEVLILIHPKIIDSNTFPIRVNEYESIKVAQEQKNVIKKTKKKTKKNTTKNQGELADLLNIIEKHPKKKK